ncbi:MAG: biotin--[acetyl-CoA-carboxylase] ligase [Clostridiales bacterium]|nr:biotin--[acetyl-CoA-carboxylase] ligase [Clostridiales bacterium]
MSKQKILAILQKNAGSFISGEAISQQLGISRAAVSKAVGSLRGEGYEIRSVTNRGYCLCAAPDSLTEGEILPWLSADHVGRSLLVFQSIDSTNNYLKREEEHLPSGTVAVANEQTGGRGRRGRTFQSPGEVGVYLSALLRPDVEPAKALDLTAYVAVAVCEGIEAATGLQPEIKWTNDIVIQGRKICGILTEMMLESESMTLRSIVTGIGINVNQREEDFPEDIRAMAGSLAMMTGAPVRRGRLTAEIINALDRMYTDWSAGGTDYLERYRRRCLTLGREVQLLHPDDTVEPAFAEDVDEQFGLVVRMPDGTRRTVTSGEVSVRGLYGYV